MGEGVSRRELQEKYSVSKTLIQLVATQGIWRHVDSEYEYKKKETNGNAVLNKEIVFELKLDMRNGMSAIATAEKYNISVATVYQIKQGRTWKDIKIEEEAEASPV